MKLLYSKMQFVPEYMILVSLIKNLSQAPQVTKSSGETNLSVSDCCSSGFYRGWYKSRCTPNLNLGIGQELLKSSID